MHKPAPSQFPLHDLLQQRWSPRAFDPNRLIDATVLLSVLEAARWSPSSANSQPWRFIMADRRNEVGFRAMLTVLSSGNQRWCHNVPLLLMIVTRTIDSKGAVNRYGGHDAGIALANLTLQAMSQGVFVHPMAGFDTEKARMQYGIPEGYEPMTITALGYYGTLDQLPDDLQTRETQPRERLPLTDLVYEGQFGHVAPLVRNRMETL